jgi:hypothetical protein
MNLAMLLLIPTARSQLIRSQTSRRPGSSYKKTVNAGIHFQMPRPKRSKRIFTGRFIISPPSTLWPKSIDGLNTKTVDKLAMQFLGQGYNSPERCRLLEPISKMSFGPKS